MINHLRWYRFAALAVAVLLAVGVSASPAGGQAANIASNNGDAQIDRQEAKIAELEMLIADRDTLIAAQESLLNDYRCMFKVDTQLVPGGCGVPARPTPDPDPEQTLPQPEPPEGTTEDQWEQLRQCSTNGDYRFAHSNEVNFGAYEFRQTTWDDLARRHYPRLVGVVPSDAARADQDRMAHALYDERGWRPWPVCATALSLLTPEDAASTNPTGLPPIPAGTTQAQWEQLIQCESQGNYRAYNPAGPYLGAFQFLQSTWNAVAARNYPRLSGIDPRDAAPADQHRMAHALYEESGWRPWPACTAAFR